MKSIFLLYLVITISGNVCYGQEPTPTTSQQNAFISVIDQYTKAREKRDTTLLKQLLTNEVDQLVSSGEWRYGINAAVQGMQKSSAASPGTRSLTVEKIRLLNTTTALVDCKYQIQQTDGNQRNMWSSFILVYVQQQWKISAIRNMLPATQ